MAAVKWADWTILRCRLCLAPVRYARPAEMASRRVLRAALEVLPDECLFCAPKRRADRSAAEPDRQSVAE